MSKGSMAAVTAAVTEVMTEVMAEVMAEMPPVAFPPKPTTRTLSVYLGTT
jgi:hypothetical protein